MCRARRPRSSSSPLEIRWPDSERPSGHGCHGSIAVTCTPYSAPASMMVRNRLSAKVEKTSRKKVGTPSAASLPRQRMTGVWSIEVAAALPLSKLSGCRSSEQHLASALRACWSREAQEHAAVGLVRDRRHRSEKTPRSLDQRAVFVARTEHQKLIRAGPEDQSPGNAHHFRALRNRYAELLRDNGGQCVPLAAPGHHLHKLEIAILGQLKARGAVLRAMAAGVERTRQRRCRDPAQVSHAGALRRDRRRRGGKARPRNPRRATDRARARSRRSARGRARPARARSTGRAPARSRRR